jgi:hypothetical protein
MDISSLKQAFRSTFTANWGVCVHHTSGLEVFWDLFTETESVAQFIHCTYYR